MAVLSFDDRRSIEWAFTSADAEIITLKWGRSELPAAALAFTASSVFVAVPVALAPSRARPAVSRTFLGDLPLPIGLVDSESVPQVDLLEMRFLEL